ncbi:MAG: cobalamin-binding protein [Nocardioides sp.]|jgi:iron complex transport system substrate-binding protein|uniref:ABC transporter substrate-binding protein n=1 Tax=Nocardioides sp. TaxID=35761 RepID=UPI0026192802|nr:ABC transporter substrate-binding protein [Nocardioides sp.]MCW2834103.1 cobalamin-binding protein [Nocardioides sp.]
MRIVSLLPSTTEILFEIGAGPDVVGVTFECDTPAEARTRRIVSTTAIPEGLTPREIDDFVVAATAAGDDLYHLDEGALADLEADLVVTQDLCAVCAVDVSVVDDALAHLGSTAEVLTIDPHTLADVLDSIRTLGRATGRVAESDALVQSLHRRLEQVVRRVARRPRPRVVVLEWTDPPFAPGHWIPEMVDLAGGEPVLGTAGTTSVRTTWEDVLTAAPDVVIVAPCGFDRAGAQSLADEIAGRLPVGIPVHAVDANASWARPGPRLLDGIEELAAILDEVSG